MVRRRVSLLFLLGTLLFLGVVAAADWPTYLHDNHRSGVTAEQPAMPLGEQWTFIARYAPQPAWPEPQAKPSRVRFDTAYHVLYFGSSADNKVYALDAKTGEERWAAFTGGPIRIAPTVSNGRVYVASDDGWAYCLNAADGKEVWKRRAAPGDERILGHGRMISLWPMRAGVMVEDGVAYFCAGIFPAEGVFIHAVRAEDGKPLWTNDTSGQMYLLQP
ncbi:MAG: PQQ-like beta-propeller repeat protein, partial [Planctomycetes bacterium]|nr:PQQ-like beta-propeller repeat protein [Planctomycetota bacterium]